MASIYMMQPNIFIANNHVCIRRRGKYGDALRSCVVDDNLPIENDVGILSLVKIWLSTWL